MFWSRLKNKKRSITGTCLQCGKCCRNIILFHRGKPVRSIKKFEKLVKKNPFYSHFYLTYKNPENGCLYFSCDRISSDNLCSDYVNRPEICKKYPQSEVFEYGGNLLPGCGYSLSSS
ncbi:MAG: YkgJ family cysteine cluster protein, partial [Candidatus Aureabacteria bacterium]|nr:YkgJ family cysteine cluster protein [Candidatus Auribacterota bacterium]